METQTRCSFEATSLLSAEAEEVAGSGRGQMPPLLRASVSPSVKQGTRTLFCLPPGCRQAQRTRAPNIVPFGAADTRSGLPPMAAGAAGRCRGQAGAGARCWEQSVLGRSEPGTGTGGASRGELRPGRVTVLLIAPFAFKEIKLFLVPAPLLLSHGGSLSGPRFSGSCQVWSSPPSSRSLPKWGAGSGRAGVRGSPGPGCAGRPWAAESSHLTRPVFVTLF